jgi:hypothetical protein
VEKLEIRNDPEADEPPRDHLLNGPQGDNEGLQQNDIDTVMGQGSENTASADAHEPAGSAASAADDTLPQAPTTGEQTGELSAHTPRPSHGSAPGTVRAQDFATPEALELENLDPAKTAALFS